MLDLIKRLTRLMCLTHQVNPNQKRSTDMITNNTREMTLASFKSCQLVWKLLGEVVQSSSARRTPVARRTHRIDSSR